MNVCGVKDWAACVIAGDGSSFNYTLTTSLMDTC